MIDTTKSNNEYVPFESYPPSDQEYHILKIYVTEQTRNSRNAITNLQKICEEHLCGRYKIKLGVSPTFPTKWALSKLEYFSNYGSF
jgi:hypothetical protein